MARPLENIISSYDLNKLIEAYMMGLNEDNWGTFKYLKWLLAFKYLINPFTIEGKLLKTDQLREELFPTEFKKEK